MDVLVAGFSSFCFSGELKVRLVEVGCVGSWILQFTFGLYLISLASGFVSLVGVLITGAYLLMKPTRLQLPAGPGRNMRGKVALFPSW